LHQIGRALFFLPPVPFFAASNTLRAMNFRFRSSLFADFSSVFLRAALATAFLSAVADRFGWWGLFGQPNVAWGDWARFVSYNAKLLWFLPGAVIPAMAVVATIAEAALGVLLLLGWQTRAAAFLSGVLLLAFAATMTVALGIKAPLNASVFTASAGAFLLATCPRFLYSVDEYRGRAGTV
jgi:uncharacterized membrane protein YphA (DoxX/SURF4 family)